MNELEQDCPTCKGAGFWMSKAVDRFTQKPIPDVRIRCGQCNCGKVLTAEGKRIIELCAKWLWTSRDGSVEVWRNTIYEA